MFLRKFILLEKKKSIGVRELLARVNHFLTIRQNYVEIIYKCDVPCNQTNYYTLRVYAYFYVK